MKLKTHETTLGRYRGITFEVAHPHDSYKFCYYIYLKLEQFNDEEFAETLWIEAIPSGFSNRKYINYNGNDFLYCLDMHGGITFYAKMFDGGDGRVIKIGCDYGHIYDRGWDTLETVIADAKSTIDDIHNKTTYLLHCSGDGRFVKESEGQYKGEHETFYSNEWMTIKEGEST